MIISTTYIKPNITIERERVTSRYFYIYNYEGIHYRIFNSHVNLQKFLLAGSETWIFDCLTESELEDYLQNLVQKSC